MIAEIVLCLLEELHHLLCRLAVDLLQGLQGVAQSLPLFSQVVEVLWGESSLSVLAALRTFL